MPLANLHIAAICKLGKCIKHMRKADILGEKMNSKGGFPLHEIFRSNRNFYCSNSKDFCRVLVKQKKISIRSKNFAQWKTAFKGLKLKQIVCNFVQ